MDIYNILSSIPHNEHYLNRYINFIKKCEIKNKNSSEFLEKHHICPKSKDLFPQYASLSMFSWNRVDLTIRQHLIAHLILVKVYPDKKSQKYALWKMFQGRKELRNNTKIYEQAQIYNRELTRQKNLELVKEGLHPFQGERNPSRRLAKEGKHHTQTKEFSEHRSKYEKEKFENGTHRWSDENPSVRKSRLGIHPWQGGDHQRRIAKKLVEQGKHNWQGDGTQQSELNAKRISEGTHNFLGAVNCVDPDGNDVMLPKDEYKKQQIGSQESWFYVHRNSKEGYRRKGFEYINPRSLKANKINHEKQD